MGDRPEGGRPSADGAGAGRAARPAGLILSRVALLRERIARQGLHDGAGRTVAQAAAVTTAIQAQDPAASRLGLRLRAPAATEADVLAAVAAERTVVRTWLMRATIHLVDTADVRWLVRLLGPSIERRFRTRWRQLGLTDEVLAACVGVLPEILAGDPLDRHELRAALDERGITPASPDPQAHTHALVYASAIGLVCRGEDRGRTATFTLLDDWVPGAPAGPSGDDALAELARRYFAAFSPATPADFTTWSGLPSSRAIALIRDELSEADVDGRPGFRLGEVEPVGGVWLLPAFDNYVLGHRHRDALLGAELRPRIFEGGMIHPSVVRDGRVVGRWRLAGNTVELMPFEQLPRTVLREVERETADLARFLGRDLSLATVG